MSSRLNARIAIKRSYAEMKAVEGGDITLLLGQVVNLDPKTKMQWVAAGLQREIYKLRGEIMRRQDAEDSRLDAADLEAQRLFIVIKDRKTTHHEKSWFRLFWEWITTIPIGKRNEYEPESFDTSSEGTGGNEIERQTESEGVRESTPGDISPVEDAGHDIEGYRELDGQDGEVDQQELKHLTMEGPDGNPVPSRQDDR